MWWAYVILSFILLLLLYKIFFWDKPRRRDQQETAGDFQDLSNLDVRQAQRGDMIAISGAGDDYDDLQFEVDRINKYRHGQDEWAELSGLYRNRRVYLEINEDDGLELTLTKGDETLRLPDLGIQEEDLVRMDEERRSDSFSYGGQDWHYSWSGEVGYFKDGLGEGEGYYAWDLEGSDGRSLLAIEKWEGVPFEAFLCQRVRPGDVQVFRS